MPDWITVTVTPATVSVPERPSALVLAAAVKSTLPLPAPVPPLVTVNQAALLTAVQEQPSPTVTATLLLPPAAAIDRLAGETAYVHVADVPACVIVNAWPPMVMLPVRDDAVGFAATPYPTVPLPSPVPPEVIVIHESAVAAVQLQPAAAETTTAPVPPFDGTDWLVGEIT